MNSVNTMDVNQLETLVGKDKQQTVYAIDTSIYIFRSYFAIPNRWHSPDSYSLNAVYGYTLFLIKFLRQAKPAMVAAAFDESLGSCFRNEIYPDYKISRALPDEDLAFQLEACKSITDLFGIKCFASDRYEADDIIATLTTKAAKKNCASCIISRDKDLGQLLIRNDDSFWDFTDNRVINRNNFADYFLVQPEQMTDFLSLVGDSVDDIPGVPGIGKKTAAALLKKYDSINNIYNCLDEVSTDKSIRGAKIIASKLKDYREQVLMAQQLVALYKKVPLNKSLKQMQWSLPSLDVLRYFLVEIGFGSRFEKMLYDLESELEST